MDRGTAEAYFFNKSETQRTKTTPHDILKGVCAFYNVKQSHLKGISRDSAIVLPRQISMYLLRTQLKLKLEEVADILKRKDHTTVIHGIDKITRMLAKDEKFKEEINRIIQSLSS